MADEKTKRVTVYLTDVQVERLEIIKKSAQRAPTPEQWNG